MRTRLRALSFAVLGLLLVLLFPRPARAAGEDAAALRTAQEVLDGEYSAGNFLDAKRKVDAALGRCGRCTGQALGPLHILLGMIASQTGQKAEAKAQFQLALQADPGAQLPPRTTPDIRAEWDEAKGSAPAAPAETGGDQPAEPTPAPSAHPARIPGWNNVDAFQEASAGLAADMAGKLPDCIEHDKKSLELEEQPRTRLHLSSCEARTGHLIDALQDAQKALEDGIKRRDPAVTKIAQERVEVLLRRIPHVTFQPAPGLEDLQVTFDERAVPANALTKRFSIDPGDHKVHAEANQNGIPLSLDQSYTVGEGQLLTVPLVLKSQAPEYLTPGQLKCMLGAKSQEDILKCLPQKSKPLVVKAGTQLSGYSDTTNVEVWSPELDVNVSSPTQGWNAGAHFLVDVVTAASPDIVSEASPPFHEQRYSGGLDGGYKLGRYAAQAQLNYSSEPDYISRGGGASVSADLNDKLITPRFGVNYNHDSVGRGPDNFIHVLDTTEFEGGVTFVLSPTSLLLVSATAQFENGDQSKPYRYVPMFDPVNVAPFVPVGASVGLVNSVRLPFRPTEQLPLFRNRYAIGARFAHRFPGATLRVEQRLYNDSWQLKATTTDGRYIVDLGKRLEVWPHARFNAQTGANFYQLAYSATVDPVTGQLVLPLYRSTDRELAPLVSLTGGGGAHWLLTDPEAKTQYGLSFQVDAMYTKYFDSLFITQRTALYGTVGFDAEFD
ncbi:MAG TPA: DUF3570 domain-containing protein [Polyangiaceae bacterium]